MANIDTYLEQIANGEYGRDVRDAIHDALEAINDSIPNSTSVSQEVISARTPGNQGLLPYDNLKQRLDTEAETLLDQAEQLATPGIRANIQITNATVGYSSLKDRLDTEYADLNRKVGRVIGRADAAATAAEEAVEVATQAKDTAVSKATEATNAANTAVSKATEASNAASSASSNAQVATNRATQASTSASDAASSAYEAVTAAQQAQQAAQSLVVDATLTQQGKPADAKKVGDELSDLKGDLNSLEDTNHKMISDDLLLNVFFSCIHDIAWINNRGLRHLDMIYHNLHKNIPDNYALLDYIESDTSKVVNTKVLAQNPLDIEIVASLNLKYFEVTDGSGAVYQVKEYGPIISGAIKSDGTGRFYAIGIIRDVITSGKSEYEATYGYRYGNNSWTYGNYFLIQNDEIFTIKSSIKQNGIKLIVNDEIDVSGNVPGNITYGSELYLFNNPIAYTALDAYREYKSCRIYGITMAVNDISIFEGVPVYSKKDGVSGIYDVVQQEFHPLVDLLHALDEG